MREERRHEVKDEEMSEGSGIARVKGVCGQQTIQRMMSLVINAMRRQGETNGDGEVVRQERCQPQAGSIKKNSKSMANCRQCDRSKATGTVWHEEPEQQRFKKNVKVRAEAQKVERLEVSRVRNDKQAAAQGEQCNDEEGQGRCSGCRQVVQRQQREVHVSPGSQSVMRRLEYKSITTMTAQRL